MKRFYTCCLLALLQFASAKEPMQLGTNFWFLAPQWTGENPWKWEASRDVKTDPHTFVPDRPYSGGINPWNPVFLDETSIYRCFRFMDWAKTNGSSLEKWSQRTQPDDKRNFGARNVAGRDGDLTGLAYEWMIDLCNRQGADMWICVPHAADDQFVRNLAKLICKSSIHPSRSTSSIVTKSGDSPCSNSTS